MFVRTEEVKYENEVREEMAQLETLLATSKRDYELLRIEFEKRMAANEQAAPLAKLVDPSLSLLMPLSLLLQRTAGDCWEFKEDNLSIEE